MVDVDTRGTHGRAVSRVTIDDMKAKHKLIGLDEVRRTLSQSEPVSSVGFPSGDSVKFKVEPAWNHALDTVEGTDLVEAFVRIGKGAGAQEFQLTKDALLEATSLIGLPKGYVSRSPANLTEMQLNWWFREGWDSKDFKLLTIGGQAGAAFTRATINPFSNLRLLDETLEGIKTQYGNDTEILADAKFVHSLRGTHLRLIIPEQSRTIERTGTDDDTWSIGLRLKNSLNGADQTSIDGYLFRYWCSNGAIETAASSGVWSRRQGGQGDEVYAWARQAVDDVLGGLEHSFDKVQALVDIPLQGEVVDVMRDIFQQYKIPGPIRAKVIENMAEATEINMYSVMQAITQAANDVEMDPGHVEQLMAVGGDLPNQAHSRCNECHRLVKG